MMQQGDQLSRLNAPPGLYFLDPNPGGGNMVLLLHGLGADSESWWFQFPALMKAGMRPVAPDLPGFGKSSFFSSGRWTIGGIARQLAGLVDALGGGPADVVGLSLGGAVAQRFALDYPGRVRKLVLVNTFACLRPRRLNELRYLAKRFVVANLRGVTYQAGSVAWRVFPTPEQAELRKMLVDKIAAADPRAYRSAMRELAWFDSRRCLKEIRAATLVISGALDNTVPLAIQAELARGIPGARRVIIPEANHAVTIDQPERFNQALIEFLQS